MGSDTETTSKPPRSPRRRIKRADIKAIADLVVQYRMNETEACLEAGIAPKTWANFKLRHKTQEAFEEMINGIRASQLRNCIGSISKAGDDREFETVTKSGDVATITKPGDWRAKAWIAERVLASDRFSQQQAQPNAVQVNIYQQLGVDVDKLLAEGQQRAKAKQQAIVVPSVRQLSAPSDNDKA